MFSVYISLFLVCFRAAFMRNNNDKQNDKREVFYRLARLVQFSDIYQLQDYNCITYK